MIKGRLLEYIDETHTYVYDGVILPSITQILKLKFGNKYIGVSQRTLERASELGTEVHKKIEEYETKGIDDDSCKELHNYKFLKSRYGFKCLQNEIPIVLFLDEEPIYTGMINSHTVNRLSLLFISGDKTYLKPGNHTISLKACVIKGGNLNIPDFNRECLELIEPKIFASIKILGFY